MIFPAYHLFAESRTHSDVLSSSFLLFPVQGQLLSVCVMLFLSCELLSSVPGPYALFLVTDLLF